MFFKEKQCHLWMAMKSPFLKKNVGSQWENILAVEEMAWQFKP